MIPAAAAPPLDVSSLNFDTSQRLRHLNGLLDRLNISADARLLDVGGYPGYMARAFPARRIVTADIYDKGHTPYVKASGAALPFADKTFDVTFACDVLEHVPPQYRAPFLAELARVSRCAVIVAGPYNTLGVAQAELIVQGLLPQSSPAQAWLAEHAECGLPSVDKTVDGLAAHAKAAKALPAGSLIEWLLFFAAQAAGEHRFEVAGAVQHFMKSYNRLETPAAMSGQVQHPYRHAIVAALDERTESALATLENSPAPAMANDPQHDAEFSATIEALGHLLKSVVAPGAGITGASGASDAVLGAYVQRLEQMLAHRGLNAQPDSLAHPDSHTMPAPFASRLKRAWDAFKA